MAQLKIVQMHKCFETLSSELRLKILENLLAKPMSVEELAEKTGTERSTVSHSLKVLKDCSYVKSEKSGKERIYSLTESFVKEMPESRTLFEALEGHSKKFACKCWRAEK